MAWLWQPALGGARVQLSAVTLSAPAPTALVLTGLTASLAITLAAPAPTSVSLTAPAPTLALQLAATPGAASLVVSSVTLTVALAAPAPSAIVTGETQPRLGIELGASLGALTLGADAPVLTLELVPDAATLTLTANAVSLGYVLPAPEPSALSLATQAGTYAVTREIAIRMVFAVDEVGVEALDEPRLTVAQDEVALEETS